MTSPFLDLAARRPILFDGAMGTTLHQHDLDVHRDYCGCENCSEVLLTSRPELIQGIHESFFAAGADAVETNSFGGARHVLGEFGLADRSLEINRLAARVARAAAEKFASRGSPRFVAGSIGPGTKLASLGQIEWDDLLESYRIQVRGLLEGGADLLLVETCQDLLQVKCAINACLDELDRAGRTPEDVPVMVSVTIETSGSMLLGTSIEGACAALAGYPIASLGLNCATGPAEMVEHVRYLVRHWPRLVSVMPNAGLPVMDQGKARFPLAPRPFADAMLRLAREEGVNVVGGCCGTTPEHIRQIAEGLRSPPAQRARQTPAGEAAGAPRVKTPLPAAVTSLYEPVEARQDSSILIIGERLNASGSRKFRDLLESGDTEGVVSQARAQLRDGSHVLDLNVDVAGRDGPGDMAHLARKLATSVAAPLMLDSTSPRVIEAGLKHAGGKCIINSANFEEGDEKFDQMASLARRYGAALVIGSIDEDREQAMARTAKRKHEIAARGYERATRVFGLAPGDLYFDPLVLPVSTGLESDRRSAAELIEGVRLIAADFPQSQITCGLSNVSFGLSPSARVVLNSVLLHRLVEAGLTSAIVHASKILPRDRIAEAHWRAADDLIEDRRADARPAGAPADFDPLQAFIALFTGREAPKAARVPAADLTIEERLRRHIIEGEREGLDATISAALDRYAPLAIINDHLLDGMRVVGELFGSGRMQLPFVLQSAEAMKASVALLTPHMDRAGGDSKGSIVLATVKGDVHDIGKNLVDIILTNNGYTVHNLGIKQSLPAILDAQRRTGAGAIGLSGLLVKSVNVMEDNLREMKSLGLRVPVLLGGAALSRHYAEGHLRGVYDGPCFYGKDAFEGLRIMDALAGGRKRELDDEIASRLSKRAHAEEVIAASRASRACARERHKGDEPINPAADAGATATLTFQPLAPAPDIPEPPFWGSRVVEDVPLDACFAHINPIALFRGQWQFKQGGMSEAEHERQLDEVVKPLFDRLTRDCAARGILTPRVVYGYFPCGSSGDALVIYDPRDAGASPGLRREIERFTFPRQSRGRRLCIADFFLPITSERPDVVAFHCVTMGPKASHEARRLFENNAYTEYLYLHGLGVETAEALAELWHKRIRQELGISGDDAPRLKDLFTQHYRGGRYSFGYPACPDMSDQARLFRLIEPRRIGCDLTENFQIDPEQSTSALIAHHPGAKYFNV
ncbi:MAG: methionine synthase [Phycisphaerales bacterium]|nr:methionine synthase [Phycisphaerales bacterium]